MSQREKLLRERESDIFYRYLLIIPLSKKNIVCRLNVIDQAQRETLINDQ